MARDSFHAYYYDFDATGCEPIDDVLRAVAHAGKAYHHTDQWCGGDFQEEGTPTECDKIQAAAEAGAKRVRELERERDEIRDNKDRICRKLGDRIGKLEREEASRLRKMTMQAANDALRARVEELEQANGELRLSSLHAAEAALDEITDLNLVIQGVKHDPRCPRNAVTHGAKDVDPCMRCHRDAMAEAIREVVTADTWDTEIRRHRVLVEALGCDPMDERHDG